VCLGVCGFLFITLFYSTVPSFLSTVIGDVLRFPAWDAEMPKKVITIVFVMLAKLSWHSGLMHWAYNRSGGHGFKSCHSTFLYINNKVRFQSGFSPVSSRNTRIVLWNSGLDPYRNIPVIQVKKTGMRPQWDQTQTGINSKIGWYASQHWI